MEFRMVTVTNGWLRCSQPKSPDSYFYIHFKIIYVFRDNKWNIYDLPFQRVPTKMHRLLTKYVLDVGITFFNDYIPFRCISSCMYLYVSYEIPNKFEIAWKPACQILPICYRPPYPHSVQRSAWTHKLPPQPRPHPNRAPSPLNSAHSVPYSIWPSASTVVVPLIARKSRCSRAMLDASRYHVHITGVSGSVRTCWNSWTNAVNQRQCLIPSGQPWHALLFNYQLSLHNLINNLSGYPHTSSLELISGVWHLAGMVLDIIVPLHTNTSIASIHSYLKHGCHNIHNLPMILWSIIELQSTNKVKALTIFGWSILGYVNSEFVTALEISKHTCSTKFFTKDNWTQHGGIDFIKWTQSFTIIQLYYKLFWIFYQSLAYKSTFDAWCL